MIAILLLMLTGCTSNQPDSGQNTDLSGNFAPENTAIPAENTSIQAAANAFSGGIIDAQPTIEPEQTIGIATEETLSAVPTAEPEDIFGTYDDENLDDEYAASRLDVSAYNFSTMTDSSLGFTFNYPSHWINNPGVYTVCYKEQVEPGDFPARVAVTRKKLTHTAEADEITEQLKSYLKTIYKQYDAKTFEVGTLNRSIEFMGKKGFSTTYLAFSGEIEVKGFVICCQIERTLYVFHFSASYDDYMNMESIMQYMCKSVKSAA